MPPTMVRAFYFYILKYTVAIYTGMPKNHGYDTANP